MTVPVHGPDGPGKASSLLSAHGASRATPSAVLGTANLAEIGGQLADADLDPARARPPLEAAGVTIEPLRAARC